MQEKGSLEGRIPLKLPGGVSLTECEGLGRGFALTGLFGWPVERGRAAEGQKQWRGGAKEILIKKRARGGG